MKVLSQHQGKTKHLKPESLRWTQPALPVLEN